MSIYIQALKPQDCDLLLVKSIEEKNIEALVALFERGAAFYLFSTGELTYDTDVIRSEFEGLISMRAKIEIEEIVTTIHQDGTLATTSMIAYMRSFAPDGQPVLTKLYTLEVLRRQSDGTWRFAIADPQGSAKA